MSNELAIIKEVSPVVSRAKELAITGPKEVEVGVEMLSQLNRFSDSVTREKEKVTKPLNEALKAERGRWKPIETMLDEAIAVVRCKLSAYQTEKREEERAAEEKLVARVEKGTIKVDTAVRKIGEIERAEAKVFTDSGSVKFRTVKKFEVIDIGAVPIEYHLIDESAIRKAMVAGVEVAGVRYFDEEVPVNSR